MATRVEHALEIHHAGLNCAQAVLETYADTLGIDAAMADAVALGFGGGMGRLQKTCGAVTGAFMVLGVAKSKTITDPKQRKETTYELVQEFHRRFVEVHGTTQCHALLGCDLMTESGRLFYKTHNLGTAVCDQCIAHAVEIVGDLIV